jgi:methyl-accepting chemotaxis protein
VAEGDFRQVKDYTGRDELGVLTRSFNAMTRQLAGGAHRWSTEISASSSASMRASKACWPTWTPG